MKTLLIIGALAGALVGCASHDTDHRGGTASDRGETVGTVGTQTNSASPADIGSPGDYRSTIPAETQRGVEEPR